MKNKQRLKSDIHIDLDRLVNDYVELLTKKDGEWVIFAVDARLTPLDFCWQSREPLGFATLEAWNEIVRHNFGGIDGVQIRTMHGSPYLLVAVCMQNWDTTNRDFVYLLELAAKNFVTGGISTEQFSIGPMPSLHSLVLRTEAELDKTRKEVHRRHVKESVQHGDENLQDWLDQEIQSFHAGIIGKLHKWLANMEGRTFENQAAAMHAIHEVTNLVRRAGRKITYQGRPVTLNAVCGKRQTRPSIQVRARKEGQSIVAANSTRWPPLRTVPADYSSDAT
jgi:hypothetical protein